MIVNERQHAAFVNIFIGFLLLYALINALLFQQGDEIFNNMHLLFDTANATLSLLLALSLLIEQYDIDTDTRLYFVVAFACSAFVETLHALVGVEWGGYMQWVSLYAHTLRPGTWPAATYLLPLGLLWTLAVKLTNKTMRPAVFAAGMLAVMLVLLALALSFKPYVDTGVLGIYRPTQIPVVFLWAIVIVMCWRMRAVHPYYEGLVWMGSFLLLSDVFMLYSTSPHEKMAMMAHVGKLIAYVFFHIVQQKISMQNSVARKTSELTLRENEARFRIILDTCPTAVRISKIGVSEVVYFNLSYAKLLEVAPEQVMGINPGKYYVNQDDYADVVQRLVKGEQVFDRLIELKIPEHPEMPHKWALASYLRIEYLGEPAVIGWFYDISERIQMDRMKSEFVSTVSHELRTPLTVISGSLGLMAGGAITGLPEQAKQMVELAYKNSQRLTRLINDLLDMDKLAAGKVDFNMQSLPIMPLIEQAIAENKDYAASRHVGIALLGTSAEIRVSLDSHRFLQVMANLISNALKFSPDDAVVDITVVAQAQTLRISVIDCGTGIPAVFHSRIFQKFTQADSSDTRKKGGTGLGLAISKELVERMGGNIGFDSTEGQGCIFYVEFPIVTASALE